MSRSLMKDDPRDEFLSVADVAQRLKVSKRTVHRLIASGELEVIRIRRSVRVSESAVQALIMASARR